MIACTGYADVAMVAGFVGANGVRPHVCRAIGSVPAYLAKGNTGERRSPLQTLPVGFILRDGYTGERRSAVQTLLGEKKGMQNACPFFFIDDCL